MRPVVWPISAPTVWIWRRDRRQHLDSSFVLEAVVPWPGAGPIETGCLALQLRP
ncbi:hypothetical protein QA600_12030 [Natronococcus sp. A-GB1]|uniref:hypothetical protein n=1 Tax=Natronococcus sp. A-GB1 TaxID=3037648 RepID=UPI00241F393B|nr:hypothetical protein [Natronococcus sp. A-GB1]MDG5760069.1 hypothetical protein [Natronococcus sp. A-GB1]